MPAVAFGAPAFTSIDPDSGPVGTQVTISGSGFDLQASYTIRVNGVDAQLDQVTQDAIKFTILGGTGTGLVEIDNGSGPISSGLPFQVTRSIPGVFLPPQGVSGEGYTVMDGQTPLALTAGNGAFNVSVPVDIPKVLVVFRDESDPVFMAIVMPSDASITVNATTTAEALAYMSPLLSTRDEGQTQLTIGKIRSRSELTTLASLIEGISADGKDYLNDARVETGLLNLVQAALTAPDPPARTAVGDEPTFALETKNPFYKDSFLQYTIEAPNELHADSFTLKVDRKGTFLTRNPLDWIVEILEVEPSQFPDGLTDIAGFEATAALSLKANPPIGQGYVRANLLLQKLDVVELAATYAVDTLFNSAGIGSSPSTFSFDKDTRGVFVAQSFSGNLWYGTTLFEAVNNQAMLRELNDPNSRHTEALVSNIAISVLDLMGAVVPLEANSLAGIVHAISIDTRKAIAIYQRSPAGINKDNFVDLIKTLTIAAAKAAVNSILADGAEEGVVTVFKRFSFAVGKTFIKSIDLMGKAAALGQSLERGTALITPQALAVERSIVVLGDPFGPRIKSFHPAEARPGNVVLVTGFNFADDPQRVRLKLIQFNGSLPPDANPDSHPFDTSLDVEVLSSTGKVLAFRLPDDVRQSFPSGEAYLSVENLDDEGNPLGERTTTARLDPPYRTLKFSPPPSLVEIQPNPVLPGGLVTLLGANFDPEGRLLNRVFMVTTNESNITTNELEVANSGSNTVVATVPITIASGTHGAFVRYESQPSEIVPFTVAPVGVLNSSFGSGGITLNPEGLHISISKLDLSNAPDGEISLLEAFLIANGTLGRLIEIHDPREYLPQGNPEAIPYQPREIDGVLGAGEDGSGGGAGSLDRIDLSPVFSGQEIVLTSPLPSPNNGDIYNFRNLILNGSGLPTNTVGWQLHDTHGVQLRNVTLRNFPGHAIHLTAGASQNHFENVRIENAGTDGVYLQSNAIGNYFFGLKISGTGRHGVHLSGGNVRLNRFALPQVTVATSLGLVENCPGHGVIMEDGASFNSIEPGTVRNNTMAGILVTGEDTDFNVIGNNQNAVPRYSDVISNGGHGVHLDSGVNNTVVRFLNPAGNQGDGIRLSGPDCAYNQVDGIYTGIDYYTVPFTATLLPNSGNGIHLLQGAHHNLIGSRTPGGFGERGAIVGNLGAGILLDGSETSDNTINRMNIGDIESSFVGFGYFANGTHGIHIRNGSHHNTLGDFHSFLDLHISSQPDGSGILIEGAGSDGNFIVGNQIGSHHGHNDFPAGALLRNGIHIRHGSRGNTIGVRGDFLEVEVSPFNFHPYRPSNVVGNCTHAGILIENASGVLNEDGTLTEPNVIQNNRIGIDDFDQQAPNTHGIVITGSSANNLVGGPLIEDGNIIANNRMAGVLFDDNSPAAPNRPTELQHNSIIRSGVTLIGGGITDPLTGPPVGVGVLVQGQSSSLSIGSKSTQRNQILDNVVGVYIDGSSGHHIRGNLIRDNAMAGVILRSATEVVVGGNANAANLLLRNGSGDSFQGGMLITGGGQHRIEGNYIGNLGRGQIIDGNQGVGIYILDSQDNVIGAPHLAGGNIISGNSSHGVRIAGGGASNNKLWNNFIGADRLDRNAANGGDGILIENGANGNMLGGLAALTSSGRTIQSQAGNIIHFNAQSGVHVSGVTTTGNSILHNSITANTLAGIAHSSGGNQSMPPPIAAVFDGTSIIGDVPSLAQIPVGSIIQVFADGDANAPEGDQFLGEARVLTGGQWRVAVAGIPMFRTLSMTATHASTGSTSPFGMDANLNLGLSVTRAGATTPGARTAPAGAHVIPVLPLSIGALNAEANVASVTFEAAGSLDDAQHIAAVKLYRDANGDSKVDAGDVLLGGPAQFETDNGSVTIPLNGDARLQPNQTQQWLLVYETLASSPEGASFSARLTSAPSVQAHFVFPFAAAATPSTTFPVVSDTFTLSALTGIASWKQSHFDAAELENSSISGDLADPDNDGLPNLIEYALGLNPRLANPDSRPQAHIENNHLVFRFRRAQNTADLSFELKASTSLPSSGPITGLFEQVSVSDNGDGTDTVTIRSVASVTANQKLFLILNVSISQP